MIRIALFRNRSLFVILLAASTANPLLAIPLKNQSLIKRSVRISNVLMKVQDKLVHKGLEKEVAMRKANKLFNSAKNFEDTLKRIENSSHLSISKDMLHDTLAKYALFEKELDLHSYSGILGLVQNTSMKKLNNKELNEIREIATDS